MKKLTSLLLTFCLLLSLVAFAANAAAADTITVTVTIADKTGKLVLAAEPVTVKDVDGDRLFTVNDTLACAHEQYYGSADGYEAEASVLYGLSLAKLWGQTNNYCFGYYLNDISCWSLLDVVKQNDRLAAFAYRDTEKWSDVYTICTPNTARVKTGEALRMTVKKLQYDKMFNLLELPVAGATITVDGKATNLVTNENGEVEIRILMPGEHVVSVTSETELLVPFATRVQTSFDLIAFVQGLYHMVVNWVMNLFNK